MLDYEALPPRRAAALFSGLRDDSRIKMRFAGLSVSPERLLLAIIADRLGFLAWAKTKDGRLGRNRPASLAALLTGEARGESGVRAFADGGAFEAARAKLIGEAGHGKGEG